MAAGDAGSDRSRSSGGSNDALLIVVFEVERSDCVVGPLCGKFELVLVHVRSMSWIYVFMHCHQD